MMTIKYDQCLHGCDSVYVCVCVCACFNDDNGVDLKDKSSLMTCITSEVRLLL